ncbi:cytochrome b5 [Lentinula aciculospora]|uniref:Cytochrome b5 n=1 Tax=Lentinula aciculospora TaxID=153920 RepID=A0A9W9AT65_9AGAR|nr:cytochrome b5 [Lentinula aciculospora]
MTWVPSFNNPGLITGALLLVPIVFILFRKISSVPSSSMPSDSSSPSDTEQEPKSIMQPARTDLLPPKDDSFTLEELKQYDGSVEGELIYVSIKGTVFDVSHRRDVYGAGKSYNIFAGNDGSKGLGMSSLKLEHAVPDYSTLDEKDMKTLNDWHAFFLVRYNVVGRVSDLPDAVKDK